jgi:ribosome biogenesis GTPase A
MFNLGWGRSGFAIAIPDEAQYAPIYLLGLPNVGKSTLIESLALQAHAQGEGVLVIDTKDGKLTKNLAGKTLDEAKTILISPGTCRFEGRNHYWGLNILARNLVLQRDFGTGDSFSLSRCQ